MDFAISANHTVKRKNSKKINKYLDLVRELKKLSIIKVTIPILIWTLGKLSEGDWRNWRSEEESKTVKITYMHLPIPGSYTRSIS